MRTLSLPPSFFFSTLCYTLSMNHLHIYPTSRALRKVSSEHKRTEGFLPALMRMDEFEKRAVLIENRMMIDPMQRILLLKEAANFEDFKVLNLNVSLVRFFTKSELIFKFFEELAAESVSFTSLMQADAYAEFTTHIEVLEHLFENYRTLLESKGFVDRAFIPLQYRLNEGFIANFEHIDIFVEGYLSRFELGLLEKISQRVPLVIHYTTSAFTLKMEERFLEYGIALPKERHLSIDFSEKKILHASEYDVAISAEVYSVEERGEQIALAFEKIERLVQSGIKAENIALILPDESLKESFSLYDRHHNLNFAMGFDYMKSLGYKRLEALWEYWNTFDRESLYRLERLGILPETLEQLSPSVKYRIEEFFTLVNTYGSPGMSSQEGIQKRDESLEQVYEKQLYLSHVFKEMQLSMKEWLYLWLKTLSTITVDDVGGGKVTVMGVLETRGMSFEGVVIVDFNDGIVPAVSGKDQFLNSSVRAFAGLPTKSDREALQKQFYKRLLEQAESTVIIYSSSDNRLPSKFLYELGLQEVRQASASLPLLYNEPCQVILPQDPVVEHFDAWAVTWSASRLKTFLECKRKYFYRYIEQIKPKEEEALNEGAFLHRLLEQLFQNQNSFHTREKMEQQLVILMDTLLPEETPANSYRKLLWKEKLQGFIDVQVEHFKAGWYVSEREKEIVGEIGGLKFKGRVDRIDRNGMQTLVLDYKSGSTAEAQKSRNLENLKDFQMSIYHQILQHAYPEMTLTFVKLFEGGKVEEIVALESKNEVLFGHIAELKQRDSFVAKKCDTLSLCGYCEFALMCERGEYL